MALDRQIGQGFNAASPKCQQLFSAIVCNSLFYLANTSGERVSVSGPLCREECLQVTEECPVLWKAYLETDLGQGTSCDNLGRLLEPLPYCCHSGGVVIENTPKVGGNAGGIAAGVTVSVLVVLVVVVMVALAVLMTARKFKKMRTILHGSVTHTHTHTLTLLLHQARGSSQCFGDADQPPQQREHYPPQWQVQWCCCCPPCSGQPSDVR